jgi:hypothetical protein
MVFKHEIGSHLLDQDITWFIVDKEEINKSYHK